VITCPICGRPAERLITLKASENGYVWGLDACPDCVQTKGRILHEDRRGGR